MKKLLIPLFIAAVVVLGFIFLPSRVIDVILTTMSFILVIAGLLVLAYCTQ